MNKTINKLSQGFTLIELLIVIAVLGILAAGTLTAINPLQQIRRAQDTQLKNDVGQLSQALQAYYTLNQFYPVDLDVLTTSNDLKQLPASAKEGANPRIAYDKTEGCAAAPYTDCEASLQVTLAAPLTNSDNKIWCWKSSSNVAKEQKEAPAETCDP